MRRVSREIRDVERFKEIIEITGKHGFTLLAKKLDLDEYLHFHHRVKGREVSGPEELREMLEDLGTVFIKLGQILAERPDLVPERYRSELEKLQHDVNQVDYEKIEEIIEEEVGIEEFDNIEKNPLASASIAQVHKASYKGEEVVVKVRRPGIDKKVTRDLEILEFLTKKGEKHLSRMKSMSAISFVQQFSKWTRQEINFKHEAMNAKTFRTNLKEDEGVKVPKVYEEVSTEKIVVLEYVEGVKCTEKEALMELDVEGEDIARTAVRANVKQSLQDGMFHADPHPSNFLVNEDGKIVYMDFGMMGRISSEQSRKLGLLLLYMVRGDAKEMTDVLESLGKTSKDYDRDAVQQEIDQRVSVIQDASIGDISITGELFKLFVNGAKNGLHMPSSLTLMGKSLVTMEGIAMTICPGYEITEEYEEIALKHLRKQNSPKDIAEEFSIDLIKNKDLISNLPSKINRALEPRQQKPVQVVQNESDDHIVPAALLIGSTLLFYQILPEKQMALVAGLELLAAAYLLR